MVCLNLLPVDPTGGLGDPALEWPARGETQQPASLRKVRIVVADVAQPRVVAHLHGTSLPHTAISIWVSSIRRILCL